MFPTRALFKRSIWKGPFVVQLPLPLVRPKEGEWHTPIETRARSCTIVPQFVGFRFKVHNGKTYHEFAVTEDMVGHKLGEFSPTRHRFTYKMSKNK